MCCQQKNGVANDKAQALCQIAIAHDIFLLFALKAKAIKLVPLENSWFSYVALVSVA